EGEIVQFYMRCCASTLSLGDFTRLHDHVTRAGDAALVVLSTTSSEYLRFPLRPDLPPFPFTKLPFVLQAAVCSFLDQRTWCRFATSSVACKTAALSRGATPQLLDLWNTKNGTKRHYCDLFSKIRPQSIRTTSVTVTSLLTRALFAAASTLTSLNLTAIVRLGCDAVSFGCLEHLTRLQSLVIRTDLPDVTSTVRLPPQLAHLDWQFRWRPDDTGLGAFMLQVLPVSLTQ